jgi:hypothetical protein
LPYIGDESNNVVPASSAAETTSPARARSSVSNVFDVPIPMIGTIGASACFGERERVSMRHILTPRC